MCETDVRSVRILFDLQACQTAGSADRGVGRYSKSLFEAMLIEAKACQLFGLVSAAHRFQPRFKNIAAERLIVQKELPDWQTERDFRGGSRDSIDAVLQSAVGAVASPDVMHVSHIFEGYGERVAIPDPMCRPAGQIYSATLYDLIPLRFRDHYFKNADFARWYYQRLKYLQQADLLLSISESSRQDAIELLGLDPKKIVTIHGGISDHFVPAQDRNSVRASLREKYSLRRPGIVLYTGGDDYRKNLAGAIEAYAAVPLELRRSRQLVIICALEERRREVFEKVARQVGLEREEVRLLGFVPDADLAAFYAACDVFFFPSIYEGLGLPVLEAMACGAPVICGDNSSLKELVGRRDALFDVGDKASIAASLTAVLGSEAFAEDLRRSGLRRCLEFSWQKSARLAIGAFDEALARKRHVGIQAAMHGWGSRLRVAVLTPLPPSRSGIADYNAKFLPYLAAHFDIDLYVDGSTVSDERLKSAFRIFEASEFRQNAKSYDAILYEFGNSEFHAHMLPLLSEFPGVVGLHDAFLSGLMGYLEFNLGEAGRFGAEALYSHAGQARRLMAPAQRHVDAIGPAMVELPCTKSVLDHAIGVISHSPFNLEIARERYPEGWHAPYRIIPQMVVPPETWTAARVSAARSALGFARDDFIIATFGHIAWTKWGDRLLKAFLESDIISDPRCYLVFAGELAKDSFGHGLLESIRKSGLDKRIRVTGFLSETEYENYLRIADVAVQLRTKSRGGTPKAVLDCLSHGLPVVVNNESSYLDYPDDVVVKLSPAPTADEVGKLLTRLHDDAGLRGEYARRGLSYVRDQHSPENCAAQYAAAICEFIAGHEKRRGGSYAARLAPHLVGVEQPENSAHLAAEYLDARDEANFARPRLFLDVSHIVQGDHGTGIQRVVKEVVRSSYCSDRADFAAVAIERQDDAIIPANAWLEKQGLLLPHEVLTRPEPIQFRPGDHLLMIDSSWDAFARFSRVFADARSARVPITTVVYDLLPVTLPEGNFVKGGREWFEKWLRLAIGESDNLLCISKAVADELIRYIRSNGAGRPNLQIGWWHLGSSPSSYVDAPLGASAVLDASRSSYALMVGTIEPRKNHALALDAFEELWAAGSELSLVVAGKPGWLCDDLLARLRTHPQRNSRLYLFEQVSDVEVRHLYRHASALLMISKGEGFGLPLVEAAEYGVPIVCSDIPSFREIAGENATFVRIANPTELAADLTVAWHGIKAGTAPRSAEMPRLSWEESAANLLEVILDERWYWSREMDGCWSQ